MPTDRPDAFKAGYDAGLRYFLPALLEPPTSEGHRAALQSVCWKGGIACAEAGYSPANDQQGGEAFFEGFLEALADAEDEAEHI
jgi:hypothetical protein